MRSKKLLALAVTGALAAGAAYAATFEGRIVCDQDPRNATSASCVLDAANSSESNPIHLTYYGEGNQDWMSSMSDPMGYVMSEPVSLTEYYVSQESDPLAGFEWVLGPELVGYYLSDSAYYVTDASTGEVIVIEGAG